MSKSWFGRLAAKVSGDRPAEPSRPSAPSPAPASLHAPSPAPASLHAPSSAPSRTSSTRDAVPPAARAAAAERASTPAATPRSEFHASAVAAASAGLTGPERVIDESTDLSTLTDQEIMRLMEGMDGDVMNKVSRGARFSKRGRSPSRCISPCLLPLVHNPTMWTALGIILGSLVLVRTLAPRISIFFHILISGALTRRVRTQPLVTGPIPLLAIKAEYENGSPTVLRKIQWLEENGWDQVWRARGDGDCFYRSFTLAYLLRILYARDRWEFAREAISEIQANQENMLRVGFQADLVEEFLGPLMSTLFAFSPDNDDPPTEFTLLQLLQDPEKSNCIVVALRLITGAYIRTHPDKFAPFLFSPTTLEPVSPDAFCREEVEPCGKEADHAQIMALSSALVLPLKVAYLDQSDITGDDVINWVEFGEQRKSATEEEARPLTLLYRPGHFDVVTKDYIMQAALAQTRHELADTPPVVPTPPPEKQARAAVPAAPAAPAAVAAHATPGQPEQPSTHPATTDVRTADPAAMETKETAAAAATEPPAPAYDAGLTEEEEPSTKTGESTTLPPPRPE
ncbi:hypothetical protein Q8F55_005627 [Vanrija albida]|uniref:ubiquitinyl hydrolase 1 n=1 Tax=Vanrija albida TaxID=181172 RepID=A0ABR3Q365_9TREE